MVLAKVFDAEGNEKESMPLNGPLFNSEVKEHVLRQYVLGFLRNQRQGTAATKTRTGVSGGGAKPWRQKGTGRARAGSNTSPLWVGGGIVWGPHPRDWYSDIPRRLKRAALFSAFSDKAKAGRIMVVEIPPLERPRTKAIAEMLRKFQLEDKRVLLLSEGVDPNLVRSCANIRWLEHKRSVMVNPYDLLWAEYVLVTPLALRKIEEVFNN